MNEQYLLQDPKGYYWICYKPEDKYELSGPHSFKPINLGVIQIENPIAFAAEKNIKNFRPK